MRRGPENPRILTFIPPVLGSGTAANEHSSLTDPLHLSPMGGGEKRREEEQTGICPRATAAAGLRPAAHFPCSPQVPRRRSLGRPLPARFLSCRSPSSCYRRLGAVPADTARPSTLCEWPRSTETMELRDHRVNSLPNERPADNRGAWSASGAR